MNVAVQRFTTPEGTEMAVLPARAFDRLAALADARPAAAFRLGYDLLWFNGIALAPAQIAQTATTPGSVSARGLDSGASARFQGFSFGVDYAF